ncbi:hydrolase [Leminorella grimontii]|uniref:Hydrolase n=1 Tax=Leminorella grimontii TaxID=82981 RepID=A0AAV5N8K5_9GAMM|nr:alpha/beta hydrolase [Leminorella grimontii]KFC92613.1 haloacetate dehalogenase H-1 [Leminorella grimontii ATCC 33999 = DSM 5078]GKX57106.1 hydrolase [Leminorella grimontii]GKX60131.1 hydrolase [Leminorella grimontii]VFS62541.1 Fluoroacetate dehalogenase [Leminorella grimontii]
MLATLEKQKRHVNQVDICFRTVGQGPALLMLHGHPQNHMMWHRVVPELSKRFTLVIADLRGYGDSDKPRSPEGQSAYSKRIMAQDMYELMAQLGHPTFSILAHDRGARVAHRLALDYADAVQSMTLLDIAPTLAMYRQTNEAFARAYWHWFMLIRPTPFPEILIEHDPALYLRSVMGARSAGMAPFTKEALAEYQRCLSLPNAAYGICEDYRASAGIDLEHDEQDIRLGNRVSCPLMVLWGKNGAIEQCFDPIGEWKKVATHLQGEALPCGHYIAEEAPELLLGKVVPFFSSACV